MDEAVAQADETPRSQIEDMSASGDGAQRLLPQLKLKPAQLVGTPT